MDALYDGTFRVAESLLSAGGIAAAAARRAVSSGYYSVFQRLSSLCASRLSRDDPESEEYRRLYRALEYKQVRNALNKSRYKAELGVAFSQLQDGRHWADYSIEPTPDLDLPEVLPSVARVYVEMARQVLRFIDSLDEAGQLKLAVVLIIRDR